MLNKPLLSQNEGERSVKCSLWIFFKKEKHLLKQNKKIDFSFRAGLGSQQN